MLCLLLAACGSLNPLSALTGSGTNVAANTQLGQENSQTVGVSNSTKFSLVRPQARDIEQSADTQKVKTDKVETINVTETPPWIIILLIAGWLLPSPAEIGRGIRETISRSKGRR